MKKKLKTASPTELDWRVFLMIRWLDVWQAANLLGGLMRSENLVPVNLVCTLYREERLKNAYVRFPQACPVKLYRPSTDGGLEPVPGPPYPARGRWLLSRRGMGVDEFEQLARQAAIGSTSPDPHPDGIWVEGLGREQGLMGRIQFELRARLPRTAAPDVFARHTGYANHCRWSSSLPDDYMNAPCLPRGALVEFDGLELEHLVHKGHLDKPAPLKTLKRDDVRVWRALSLLLFALVSRRRRRYTELGDLGALARNVHEELAVKGAQCSARELLGCLLFAAGTLSPGSLSPPEVQLAVQLKPSLARLYEVILELAIYLYGFRPTAKQNPCITVIASNLDHLGFGESRSVHTVRRHLARAVQERWPAELERMIRNQSDGGKPAELRAPGGALGGRGLAEHAGEPDPGPGPGADASWGR